MSPCRALRRIVCSLQFVSLDIILPSLIKSSSDTQLSSLGVNVTGIKSSNLNRFDVIWSDSRIFVLVGHITVFVRFCGEGCICHVLIIN